MRDDKKFSDGEELLARVLDECLEEDLSFVPPEREIARKHQFSEAFEEAIKHLLSQQSVSDEEDEIRKHFSPRYGQWAACILLFCVCGWLFFSIVSPIMEKSSTGDMAPAEAPAAAEGETQVTAGMMEGAEAESAPEEEQSGSPGDAGEWNPNPEGRLYCGKRIYPAKQQEVPETLEHVTTLVNCPVQDEENHEIYLTIGNIGEETVRYLNQFDLEVWLEDGWYTILPKTGAVAEWVDLEAGMAVDEVIDLANYEIDHDAERYRVIACVDEERISAEFTFEEVFTETMKQLEEEEASGE